MENGRVDELQGRVAESPATGNTSLSADRQAVNEKASNSMMGAIVAAVVFAAVMAIGLVRKGTSWAALAIGGILAAGAAGFGTQRLNHEWPFEEEPEPPPPPRLPIPQPQELTIEDARKRIGQFIYKPENPTEVRKLLEQFPELTNDRDLWLSLVATSMYLKDREFTDYLLKPFFAKPLLERDQYEKSEISKSALRNDDEVVQERLAREERELLGITAPQIEEAAPAQQLKSTTTAAARTEFHEAVDEENIGRIKLLLEKSRGVEQVADLRGFTPLHSLVRNLSHWERGSVHKIADILLSHNPSLATLKSKNNEQLTPADIIRQLDYEKEFPDQAKQVLDLLENASKKANVPDGQKQSSITSPHDEQMRTAISQFHEGQTPIDRSLVGLPHKPKPNSQLTRTV